MVVSENFKSFPTLHHKPFKYFTLDFWFQNSIHWIFYPTIKLTWVQGGGVYAWLSPPKTVNYDFHGMSKMLKIKIKAPSTGQYLYLHPWTLYWASTLYTVHCTLYTVLCTLYTVLNVLYTVLCTLYSVHCTLYTVYCTLYSGHCILYSVHCRLLTVHCTLDTVHRSLFTLGFTHCAVNVKLKQIAPKIEILNVLNHKSFYKIALKNQNKLLFLYFCVNSEQEEDLRGKTIILVMSSKFLCYTSV